jgi:hypothetical protein
VNLEGSRNERSARQQPDALVRRGLGTQRKLLPAICDAAATNVDVFSEAAGARRLVYARRMGIKQISPTFNCDLKKG